MRGVLATYSERGQKEKAIPPAVRIGNPETSGHRPSKIFPLMKEGLPLAWRLQKPHSILEFVAYF